MPVRPIQLNYKCDVCNNGYYYIIPGLAGFVITANISDETKYKHQCNNPDCKDVKIFNKHYPRIEYTYEGQLLDLSYYEKLEQ